MTGVKAPAPLAPSEDDGAAAVAAIREWQARMRLTFRIRDYTLAELYAQLREEPGTGRRSG